MAQQHFVSVALASHNGGQFVSDQVRSILEQSSVVDEIVLSDDASRDGTIDEVRNLLVESSSENHAELSLRLLHNELPLGVTRNFEQAIKHCSGELIALSDQDDVWRRDKIARIRDHLQQHASTLLVFTNARNVDEDGRPLGYTLFEALEVTRAERRKIAQGRAFEVLLRRNLATGATVVFRRELFELAAPFVDDWLHDEWLAIVAASLNRVSMLDDTLIDYRQHSANQIGQRKLSLIQKSHKLSRSLTERTQWLLRRAQLLNQFLGQLEGVPEEYLLMAEKKLAFETARRAYPLNRIARIPHIVRHLVNGNYRRYGTGLKDAVRNLLQPA